MSQVIVIDRDLLRRALAFTSHFAAKADIRQYINGIRFEPGATGGYMVLTATDGNMIGTLEVPAHEVDFEPFTVPTSTAKQLLAHLALKGSTATREMVKLVHSPAELCTAPGGISLTTAQGTVSGLTVPVDHGRYPDWRRVVVEPGRSDEQYLAPAGFDPALIERTAKAAKDLAKGAAKHPRMIFNQATDRFFCWVEAGDLSARVVIMGYRK